MFIKNGMDKYAIVMQVNIMWFFYFLIYFIEYSGLKALC